MNETETISRRHRFGRLSVIYIKKIMYKTRHSPFVNQNRYERLAQFTSLDNTGLSLILSDHTDQLKLLNVRLQDYRPAHVLMLTKHHRQILLH